MDTVLKSINEKAYNKYYLTDRTILELCHSDKNISGESLTQFGYMLKKMGVNLIELGSKALAKHIDIPMQWALFRIENEKDIEICLKNDINYVIFAYDNTNAINGLEKLSSIGVSITVDIKADTFKSRGKFMEALEKQDFLGADTVRITGITDFENNEWMSIIKRIQRHDIQIDICPYDMYFTGTAIAYDYINYGANYITASFSGYGKDNTFAPIEEIMVSEYVLGEDIHQFNLSFLPEMVELFVKLSGTKIDGNKPVIGADIFAVESGIHTHGLDKCSITYEPFAPEMVGQQRSVMIGKHSGRKSIERKLIEMGLDTSEYDLTALLEAVREESIIKRRALRDVEIKTLLCRGKLVCR